MSDEESGGYTEARVLDRFYCLVGSLAHTIIKAQTLFDDPAQ